MWVNDFSALRYAMVGGFNTVLGLLLIYTGIGLCGLDDLAANALGYGFAFLLSFALNKSWTFRHDGAYLPALLRFVGVMAVAYLGNLVTLLALVANGLDSYLAQAAGVVPYATIGYLGSRFLAFTPTGARADGGGRRGAVV